MIVKVVPIKYVHENVINPCEYKSTKTLNFRSKKFDKTFFLNILSKELILNILIS